MIGKITFGRSRKEVAVLLAASFLLLAVIATLVLNVANPAPPRRIVISTGDSEGNYQEYARRYREIIKEDGVELEIRPSSGGVENLKHLGDRHSDVDVAFVQDGLGSPEAAPDLSSLGSLYYEPIWIFYRASAQLNRLTDFRGKRVAIGREGGGTRILALRLLKLSGIDSSTSRLVTLGWQEAASALQNGEVDAAIFLATPDDPFIGKLMSDSRLQLMSLDQAEAIARNIPFLHHLVLPHGAMDLKRNLPAQDTHLVSPTATLLVRDSLHPALSYLLLKAAAQIHNEPGIFERKDEFPIDKDYQFPLSDEAKQFYKSGAPFWYRYLPFWIATLVERFILLVIPALALIIPTLRLIPRYFSWRVRSRIYQRYGELKYLETQIKPGSSPEVCWEFLQKLDGIEERVNLMKVPLDFTDHLYVLREHIHFVRERLRRAWQLPENARK